MVDREPFAPQHDVQSRTSKPSSLLRQLFHPCADNHLFRLLLWPIVIACSGEADSPASPPDAQPKALDHISYRFTLRLGLYEFFAITAFRT